MSDPDASAVRAGGPAAGLVALVRTGVLDAELAGLLWVLIEGGMSLVVAGPGGAGRAALRDALVELAVTATVDAPGGPLLVTPDLVAVAHDDPGLGAGPALDAGAARDVVRAATRGSQLAATVPGGSLAAVLDALGSVQLGLGSDELSYLGLVLVLGPDEDFPSARERLLAAHWLRPVARDAHGHVQRLGPAVLATWDPRIGRWEHFAWGVMPELAARIDRPVGAVSSDAADRSRAVAASAALGG